MNKKASVNNVGWQGKKAKLKSKNPKLKHSGEIKPFKSLGIKERQKTTSERGQFE